MVDNLPHVTTFLTLHVPWLYRTRAFSTSCRSLYASIPPSLEARTLRDVYDYYPPDVPPFLQFHIFADVTRCSLTRETLKYWCKNWYVVLLPRTVVPNIPVVLGGERWLNAFPPIYFNFWNFLGANLWGNGGKETGVLVMAKMRNIQQLRARIPFFSTWGR